jgi:hypothetical protein
MHPFFILFYFIFLSRPVIGSSGGQTLKTTPKMHLYKKNQIKRVNISAIKERAKAP